MNVRTDLAIEAREMLSEKETGAIPGIFCETAQKGENRITRVRIESEEGERALGKKRGNYVTVENTHLRENDPEMAEEAARILSEELRKMVDGHGLTLVAGLGNDRITPDSLGPKVIPLLVVTRHLFSQMPESLEGLSPVCALSPGVLGITGIETGEIIRGVCERVKPAQVIVIDALAARRTARVGTTIQLSDSGISPGSGVGNSRRAIDRETLGVPVVAIGVPTVVDALTIADDILDMAGEGEREKRIRESLPEEAGSMMVTPKDIDALSDRVAYVVANGINYCLHENITAEDIAAFTG